MKIPDEFFRCPFPVRVSPDVELARRQGFEGLSRFGIARSEQRARLVDAWRSDELMARTYPLSRGADLVLMTNFMNLTFDFDDLFDADLGRRPDLAAEAVKPVIEVFDHPPGWSSPDAGPLVSSFSQLWRGLAEPMSEEWRTRFGRHFTDYLRMYVWESSNRAAERIPDLASYVPARRKTSAVGPFVMLAERAHRLETPPAIWTAPELLAMLDITIDHVAWTNDVYALTREQSRHDVHNLVLSIMQDTRCDSEQAIDRVAAMVAELIDRYLELRVRIPAVCDRLALGMDERAAVDRFVDSGMESWMSGNIDWTVNCTQRYRQTGDRSLSAQVTIS
jgi:hypothetical protein